MHPATPRSLSSFTTSNFTCVIDGVREKMPNVNAASFPGVNNVEKKTPEQGEIPLQRHTSQSHISKSAFIFLPLKPVLFLGRQRREHIDDVCV